MFSGKKAISTVAVIVLAFGMLLTACGNDLSANTMRLLKTEGIVKLEVDGVEQEFVGDQRLADGNALKTEVASLASIGLDETKIVTLDESSRAQFHKDGKKLALDLTEGSVFFQVSKKLEDDELFEIGVTDTMVGIRGTSGVISADDNGRYSLYLTDGEVEITAVNPETGERKTASIVAPRKVSVFLYSDRPMGKTLEFIEVPLEPDMLPAFAINQIYSDEQLMQKISEQTGWTATDISLIHDRIEEGDYEPAPSDALELGLAEPDDIARELGISDNEQEETESDEKQNADDQSDSTNIDQEINDEHEIATNNTRTRTNAVSNTAVATPGITVVAIREDGIWVLSDGTLFDPAFYAENNSDAVGAFGNDPNALLQHYLMFGRNEDRPTYLTEEARAQQIIIEAKNREAIAQVLWAQASANNQPVAEATTSGPEPAPTSAADEGNISESPTSSAISEMYSGQ